MEDNEKHKISSKIVGLVEGRDDPQPNWRYQQIKAKFLPQQTSKKGQERKVTYGSIFFK